MCFVHTQQLWQLETEERDEPARPALTVLTRFLDSSFSMSFRWLSAAFTLLAFSASRSLSYATDSLRVTSAI